VTGRAFLTRPATRRLLGPLTLVVLAGLAMTAIGWQLIGQRSWPEPGADRIIALLPALLVVGLALIGCATGPPTRIAALAAVISVIAGSAGPFLVDRLPGSPASEVVWVATDRVLPRGWLLSVLGAPDPTGTLLRDALLTAAILLGVAAVWGAVSLAPLLCARRPPASMGIDVTLLVGALAVIALLAWRPPFGPALGPGDPFGELTRVDLWVITRTLAWAVPLIAWVAVACRQGGAVAVGAAAGLVLVTGALPWLMDRADGLTPGMAAAVAPATGDTPGGALPIVAAAMVVNPLPPPDALILIAVALLVVTLAWVSSPPLIVHPDRPTATTASPVNGTAVVAFILAWLPPTAVPAIVLGHIAYDNVHSTLGAQRGAGLARTAILIGYASLALGVFWVWRQVLGR